MNVAVLGLTIVSVFAFQLVVSIPSNQLTLNPENNEVIESEHNYELTTNPNNTKSEDGLKLLNLNETSTSSVGNSSKNHTENKPFRLPTSVIPLSYKLQVLHILDEVNIKNDSSELPFERFTSPGKVWITVEVVENTKNITLHAEDMEIKDVKVKSLNSTVEKLLKISEQVKDKDVSFLILHFEDDLPIGKYEVYIQYIARIAGDRLNGLYLDYYTDPKSKEKRYLATTLFAPNHARKAFPCFDEPALRATFDITIGRMKDKYLSLSNMQLASTTPIEGMVGWVWDTFFQTPSMSTYIVAMITCDFEVRNSFFTNSDGTNTTIQIYLPSYLMNYSNSSTSWPTDYSINNVEKTMPYFGNYFESEYPLKKLALISLPHFFFSAMENWGMITFKDPVLINIQNVTTEKERDRISEVLSHELSHQWFGNLVAIDWWSHVWLKEGFSVLYSYLGRELTHPELHAWVHFTTNSLQVAMKYDEGLDTHPLENPPKNSAAIGDIYTKIPYEKGASILRMTSAFLTSTVFDEGVRLYVKQMAYKSAHQDDFFEALQAADNKSQILKTQQIVSSVTVKDIMDTWTKQSGYPIVRVSLDNDRSILKLSQEKFVNPQVLEIQLQDNSFTSSDKNETTEEPSWWIPITLSPKISCQGSLNIDSYYTDVWIPQNEKEIFVDYKHTDKLFLVNPDAIGYYRVLYDDPEVIGRIEEQLLSNHSVLKPVTRSQLLNDYFALGYAQYVPIEQTLNLTKYLHQESQLVVWKSVLIKFDKMYELLRDRDEYQHFKKYMLHKLLPAWKFSTDQLKDLQDITEKTRLHALLFKHVCQYDHSQCEETVKGLLESWLQDKNANPISADDQNTSYCAVMATSSPQNINSTWSFFENLYHNEYFSVLKYRYLKALACATDVKLLKRLLTWTIDNSTELHDVDRVKLFQLVIENPLGKPIVMEFLDENFSLLYKKVSAANPVIEGLKKLAYYMNSQEDLQKLEDFISKYSEELGAKKKALEKLAKKVKVNILWVNSFALRIQTWTKKAAEFDYYNIESTQKDSHLSKGFDVTC